MNFNGKKITVISLAAVALLAVFVAAYIFVDRKASEETQRLIGAARQGDRAAALKLADKLPQLPDDLLKQQVVAAIVDSKNISDCEKAKGLNINNADYYAVCRDNINYALALEQQNLEYCKKIEFSGNSRDECELQVLTLRLSRNGDLAVCGESASEKVRKACQGAYWLNQSLANNDIVVCGNMTDDTGKFICQSGFLLAHLRESTFSSVSCGTLSEPLKSDCQVLKKNIDRNKESAACSQIKSGGLRLWCKERIGKL